MVFYRRVYWGFPDPFHFLSFSYRMSSILPTENSDIAAASAGKVILEKLNRQLGQRGITAGELTQALAPL